MKINEDKSTITSLIFSLHEEVGALAKALNVFEVRHCNLIPTIIILFNDINNPFSRFFLQSLKQV